MSQSSSASEWFLKHFAGKSWCVVQGKAECGGKEDKKDCRPGQAGELGMSGALGRVEEVSPKVLPEGLGPTEGKGSHRRWGMGKIPNLNKRGLQGLGEVLGLQGAIPRAASFLGQEVSAAARTLQG